MNEKPEQIWIQTDHIPDHVALDQIDEKPDADEAHQFTSYTRTDAVDRIVQEAVRDAQDKLIDDLAGRFEEAAKERNDATQWEDCPSCADSSKTLLEWVFDRAALKGGEA